MLQPRLVNASFSAPSGAPRMSKVRFHPTHDWQFLAPLTPSPTQSHDDFHTASSSLRLESTEGRNSVAHGGAAPKRWPQTAQLWFFSRFRLSIKKIIAQRMMHISSNRKVNSIFRNVLYYPTLPICSI